MPDPSLLYSVFHLNLCYSSIEEAQRSDVIERCYWPLLRLARDNQVPIGIEASGFTLETIFDLDPSWISALRKLIMAHKCELVGSGYAQLIGPLVPAPVNAANQRLGFEIYQELLSTRPAIALVSEQAYSAGLVDHYLDAGYGAIMMDWDNPARSHPEWPRTHGARPQRALGCSGRTIPIVWSHSLGFQRFQRFAHGDSNLSAFIDYLARNLGESDGPTAFPVYTNDVEIFDFRPGRHKAEPTLGKDSEWQRIAGLYAALGDNSRYQLVLPGSAIDLVDETASSLSLESLEYPLPLKKQDKYSIARWAVTGRDDATINSKCWQIYETLRADRNASEDQWQELCFLWSSDFRTHISDSRWSGYQEKLNTAYDRSNQIAPDTGTSALECRREDRWLDVQSGDLELRLDCARGGAIEFLRWSDGPASIGTLRHGFFTDITLGADWYSGHVVFEPPGRPKTADLSPAEPQIDNNRITFSVDTDMGPVTKTFQVDDRSLTIDYKLDWPDLPLGTLRLGFVTLDPRTFDQQSLWIETENGGASERFDLTGTNPDHGAPASPLVSSRSGLGMTGGSLRIGDDKTKITISVDQTFGAPLALLTYTEVDGTFFMRIAFSLREIDDTVKPGNETTQSPIRFRLSLSA